MASSPIRYDNHEDEWRRVLDDADRRRVGDTWFDTETLDAWRHARMRAPLAAFIAQDPQASWLTIGDGRYGTDANFLLRSGARSVHCTDISDTLLRIGHERGFIQSYSAQNAEALAFADGSFDYVYCKEALHHFPRPYVALYEMFRVARKAVILTEPRDQLVESAPLGFLWRGLKRVLGRTTPPRHTFESVGNYVYAVSERDLEKFLLGMHHTDVAFTGCNDIHVPGVEFVPQTATTPAHRKIKTRLIRRIALADLLCRLGLAKSALLTAALFKVAPSGELARALADLGWALRKLPANPYLAPPPAGSPSGPSR
ncbi:MAG: class I SAM-dependent methyltransferase [Zoogloeaceae bacterium]|nr:class I SAM-dependent methyltransferase [Zoogloeaceae bacterium]